MARILLAEAQAWGEPTKLNITALDPNLLAHIETETLSRLGSVVDTSTWIDNTTTPSLVRTAISKLYVSWLYDRQYSEDVEDGNAYAARLNENAEMIITGIINGTIDIPGVTDTTAGEPLFYPTDISSASDPTVLDPSLGPSNFSMSTVF